MQKSIILFLCLILVSCVSKPIETRIITKPVEIEIYQPPLPEPISLETPYFYVVTEKILEDFLQKLRSLQGGDPVFIAITPRDYEKLASNLQESRRYRIEMTKIVDYYRVMTQPKTWEEANEKKRKEALIITEVIKYEFPPTLLEKTTQTIGDIMN